MRESPLCSGERRPHLGRRSILTRDVCHAGRRELESCFGYALGRGLDEIRPWYRFDVSCRGSVPEAVIAFLESRDCEDAVRKAVSLGGTVTPRPASAAPLPPPTTAAFQNPIAVRMRSLLPEELLELIDRFSPC